MEGGQLPEQLYGSASLQYFLDYEVQYSNLENSVFFLCKFLRNFLTYFSMNFLRKMVGESIKCTRNSNRISQQFIRRSSLYLACILDSISARFLLAIHFQNSMIFNLNLSQRKEKILYRFLHFTSRSLGDNCRVVSRIHLESWTRHQCCAEVYNN